HCDTCRADTQPHPLEITLASGTSARTDRLAVNLIEPPQQHSEPWWKVDIDWKITLGVSSVLVLGIGFGAFKFRIELQDLFKKKHPVKQESPKVEPPVVIVADRVPPAQGRHIELTVVAGSEHGRVNHINLVGKSVIGRDPACDASYSDDSEMSAKHCELI